MVNEIKIVYAYKLKSKILINEINELKSFVFFWKYLTNLIILMFKTLIYIHTLFEYQMTITVQQIQLN